VTGRQLAASVAWALAGVALTAGAQQPTFRAGVEAVRVDVLVTQAGRTVPGLRPQDFDLLDNGVPQRVDLVDHVEMPLNVVFVFDLSESVAGEPLSHLKAAGRAVLEGLRPDDRVALVDFSDSVRLASPLTTDHDKVAGALAELLPGGGTSWVDAAFAGLMVAESEPGRSLVLVFTDGMDTSSWLAPDDATGIARRTGVVVYGVSAGAARKPSHLAALADATGGRLIEVDTTAVLRGTFLQILDEFRHRYVLAFSPRGVSPTGWHALEVRTKLPRATVKARPGYYAETRRE
jgi:Ca-activated chloride channel homolog